MRRRFAGDWVVAVAAALWALVCGIGFLALLESKAVPGDPGRPPSDWPAGTGLGLDPNRPTVILFAHPQCPCTRATIEELARVLARCPGRATVHVAFCRPAGVPPGWEHTDLWRLAEALPDARVAGDPDRSEAARFGARTSGHVVAYTAEGRLRFRGGITALRGHAGDNEGADALVALLMGEVTGLRETPVFGCPLHDRCPACAEKGEPCNRP